MKFKNIFFIIILFVVLAGCGQNINEKKIVIFHAPAFSPLMDLVKPEFEKATGIKVHAEISGSQVVCRKITELGREADLIMVADRMLPGLLAKNLLNWQIDFARDEVVLGIGVRARRLDHAEKNWVEVLLKKDIELGRVNENLGPIGYRTLLVWKLMEMNGQPGLMERLKNKSLKIVDHVGQLSNLLKAGEIDYGFLYKSTCVKYDIRFIPLDVKINLGNPSGDYRSAMVTFKKVVSGKVSMQQVTGNPIVYALAVPDKSIRKKLAYQFISYILNKKNIKDKDVLTFIKPRFYGEQKDYQNFKRYTEFAGGF